LVIQNIIHMQTNMKPSPKHKETTHKTMCEREFALHKNHKTNNVCFWIPNHKEWFENIWAELDGIKMVSHFSCGNLGLMKPIIAHLELNNYSWKLEPWVYDVLETILYYEKIMSVTTCLMQLESVQ
jgi:hypothetical protein